MPKELDTSWFDIQNYEALKTLSIEGWQRLLEERTEFYGYVDDCNNEIYKEFIEKGYYPRRNFLDTKIPPKELSHLMVNLLKQGITAHFEHSTFPSWQSSNKPIPLKSSVSCLTVSDVWRMSRDYCQEYSNLDQPFRDRIEVELISSSTPFDYSGPFGIHKGPKGIARIKIDLFATDEQIKKDFSQWLINARLKTKIKSQKKLYTKADFDYWIEYGVIPYLDLTLIAKITGKKITQNKLARLLFPHEYNIDIVGRLRQVTKPVAEQLIRNETHRTLSTQLFSEKETGMKNT